jgi:hypothetical protein
VNSTTRLVLLVLVVAIVMAAVGIVVGLAIAPSHPFAAQDFSGLLPNLVIAIVGGLIVEWRIGVYRRSRDWWVLRSATKKRKEVERLEKHRDMITNYHNDLVVFNQYKLSQLLRCAENLALFLLLEASGVGLLNTFNTLRPSGKGNIARFFSFELSLLSLFAQLFALYFVIRMSSNAISAVEALYNVEHYEVYLDCIREQISKFTLTGTTTSNASIELGIVASQPITDLTSDEEKNAGKEAQG